ncbi:MAG: MFS transporter [Roseburia sp.]|jgi:GPH family glycoside/pentoside/hexuronide:cation symporter|nr:MFS transporter [Roseburia sp.]
MQEKTYLKWYHKLGYGCGDIAGNVVYAFLSSFVMIYLTNTVGLNPGVAGTLIAASKVFDGVTDIFFGAMIDKTKSRLGKARPWMLYAYIGCAVTLAAIFAIPTDFGKTAQYAWFFIAYTLLNAVFYTANNIAYSALTTLVTKNSKERVQMGSCRFIFAFATSLLIQSVTIGAVSAMGGGAAGWRTVAIFYAAAGLIINTISVLSVKELPEEELKETAAGTGGSGEHTEENAGGQQADKMTAADAPEEKYGLLDAAKLLIANKYYLMICAVYILQQVYGAMLGMGIYYMTYVLGNENLFGVFSWAINIPMIGALLATPALVARWKGMYKLNVRGYMLGTAGRALVIAAGYFGNIPLMLLFTGVAALGQGPWQGDMNAVIASCSEYTWLTKHKRVDGTMYSCTSLGVKLGGGLGTAIAGWMLAASGFVEAAPVQPESCIRMLYVMYLWLPMIISLLITLILSRMNVEGANERLRRG